jgi:uncharacterized protein with HEPN domain
MADRDYLLHIEKAINEIRVHTAGLSQDQFESDSKTQRAVERNLQIVGEAVRRLSDGLKQARPEIDWSDISAARNRIVHQYFGVNQKIVWDILQEDLDPLLNTVRELLEGGE